MQTRITSIRRYFGLSMEAFGSRIGLTKSMVSRMESGNNQPTERTLISICREFNVNEEWLRTGAGEMLLPESTDILSQLAAEYHLSRGAYIAVEKFVKLKPEIQTEILNYFTEVALALHSSTSSDSITKPLAKSPME